MNKYIILFLLLILSWACSSSESPKPEMNTEKPVVLDEIEDVTLISTDNQEEVLVLNSTDNQEEVLVLNSTDNQPQTITEDSMDGKAKTYNPVKGEYVSIQFESITQNEHSTYVTFTLTNTKDTLQSIYITDIRLINRSKRTLKNSELDNKWAIPGENDQIVFKSKIDGWQFIKDRINYKKMRSNESERITVSINRIPNFNKYNYNLSITCNNDNIVIIRPTI